MFITMVRACFWAMAWMRGKSDWGSCSEIFTGWISLMVTSGLPVEMLPVDVPVVELEVAFTMLPGLDQHRAGLAVHRASGWWCIQVQAGGLDIGLGFQIGGLGVVEILPGDGVSGPAAGCSGRPWPWAVAQRGRRIVQSGLIGARIDLEQRVAGLDHLAFGEEGLGKAGH